MLVERLDKVLERDDDMIEPIWHLLADTGAWTAPIICHRAGRRGRRRRRRGELGGRRDELVELLDESWRRHRALRHQVAAGT